MFSLLSSHISPSRQLDQFSDVTAWLGWLTAWLGWLTAWLRHLADQKWLYAALSGSELVSRLNLLKGVSFSILVVFVA